MFSNVSSGYANFIVRTYKPCVFYTFAVKQERLYLYRCLNLRYPYAVPLSPLVGTVQLPFPWLRGFAIWAGVSDNRRQKYCDRWAFRGIKGSRVITQRQKIKARDALGLRRLPDVGLCLPLFGAWLKLAACFVRRRCGRFGTRNCGPAPMCNPLVETAVGTRTRISNLKFVTITCQNFFDESSSWNHFQWVKGIKFTATAKCTIGNGSEAKKPIANVRRFFVPTSGPAFVGYRTEEIEGLEGSR